MPMLSCSPACTSVSRVSCSCASSSAWLVCTSLLISIMLSVISGVTLPGNGLRLNRCSKSGLDAVRSKSDRLTSCSSSSTPMVSGCDDLNGSSAMLTLLFGGGFAGPDQRALGDDRTDHLQHQRHRRQRGQFVDQHDA